MNDNSMSEEKGQSPPLNVRKNLYSGASFMVLTRMIVKSIGLISAIVLARLLIPEDFGLVAIASALYAFVELFGAFGFQTALIQNQESSEEDYDTAWTLKLLFGLFSAVVMFLIAPHAALYYEDDRLTEIIYVVGIASLVNGAANIGVVDFQKDLNFYTELKFQVIPKILSFTITMLLALYFRSYWALVLGSLVNSCLLVCFSYIMHSFRPRLSLKSSHRLFSFSKWMLLHNIIFFVNNRLTELVIGRQVSPTATGLYSVGSEFGTLASVELAAPINKASFPIYSKLSGDMAKLKLAYLDTLTMICIVGAPAALGIVGVAQEFVPVILGEKWKEIVPLMQWLAASSIMLLMSSSGGYIYMACGRPQVNAYLGIFRTVVFLPVLFVSLDVYGLVGAGIALFIASIAVCFMTNLVVAKFLNIGICALIKVCIRPVAAASVMLILVLFTPNVATDVGEAALLAIKISVGVVSYCGSLVILWVMVGKPLGLESSLLGRVGFR